jgi:hypothetical protein
LGKIKGEQKEKPKQERISSIKQTNKQINKRTKNFLVSFFSAFSGLQTSKSRQQILGNNSINRDLKLIVSKKLMNVLKLNRRLKSMNRGCLTHAKKLVLFLLVFFSIETQQRKPYSKKQAAWIVLSQHIKTFSFCILF